MTYALYLRFPQHQFFWSIIAVLLVLAPDQADAYRLAVTRIRANGIGSLVGLLISLLGEPVFISICAGVVLTILVCWFLKLSDVTRSALAALVIVMIRSNPAAPWQMGLERMGCVLAGCLVGLVITFFFHARLPQRAR